MAQYLPKAPGDGLKRDTQGEILLQDPSFHVDNPCHSMNRNPVDDEVKVKKLIAEAALVCPEFCAPLAQINHLSFEGSIQNDIALKAISGKFAPFLSRRFWTRRIDTDVGFLFLLPWIPSADRTIKKCPMNSGATIDTGQMIGQTCRFHLVSLLKRFAVKRWQIPYHYCHSQKSKLSLGYTTSRFHPSGKIETLIANLYSVATSPEIGPCLPSKNYPPDPSPGNAVRGGPFLSFRPSLL